MSSHEILIGLAGVLFAAAPVVFATIGETLTERSGIINLSVNEVLSRTFVTSLTTLLALLSLFLLGGSVIHDFSFSLLVGVIIGTYSSVFVASPLLAIWRKE